MTERRHNKFADLIQAAREPDAPLDADPTPSSDPPGAAPPDSPTPPASMPPAEAPRRGRPPTGKRSNPAYEQVTLYLRKETTLHTKIALLQAGNPHDVSDLVEALLQAWLREQQ